MSSILKGKYYAMYKLEYYDMYKLEMYKRNVCATKLYLYFIPI